MNFFHRLNNLLRTGNNSTSRNNQYISPLYLSNIANLNLSRQTEYVSISGNEEMYYNTTPELKIVIDRLALMFSNGVFKVIDKNGEEVENDPALDLLENPNVVQSRNEFLFQWWVQRCLYPGTFMYQLKGFESQQLPSALWNLSPSLMQVKRTGKIWKQTNIEGIISEYVMCYNDTKTESFKPNEIISFSSVSANDPIMGESPLHGIRMPLSNIRAAYGYRNLILTKRGALGVWSSDSKDSTGTVTLNPKEKKEMEESLLRQYGIFDEQIPINISGKSMKFTPATFPTKDLLLFEEVDANKGAIIDFYGANKNMFSMDKSSTFTNVEMAEKNCYQDTIIPTADDFTNNISKRFGYLDQGKRIILDYSHIPTMQTDESEAAKVHETKARAYSTLIASGMAEPEARDIVGL